MESAVYDDSDLKKEDLRQNTYDNLSILAPSVLHEVKNSLQATTAILNLLEQMEKLSVKGREWMQQAQNEMKHTCVYLTDFLRMSTTEPELAKPCDLSVALNEVRQIFEPYCLVQGIKLKWPKDLALPLITVSDMAVRKIIFNFLINAAQSGATEVILRTELSDKELIIHVEDNGCGVKPEFRTEIFSPLFTTKEKGTGLGLSYCAYLAKVQNAQIVYKDRAEGGSCFQLHMLLDKE